MAAFMNLRKGSKLASSALNAARSFSTTPSAERKVAVLGAAGRQSKNKKFEETNLSSFCQAWQKVPVLESPSQPIPFNV